MWNHAYDQVFAKRAFYHYHIGEGVEGGMAYEAREEVASLQRDYNFRFGFSSDNGAEHQEGEE